MRPSSAASRAAERSRSEPELVLQTLEIKDTLPGLNEILDQMNRSRYRYNRWKHDIQVRIQWEAKACRLRPVQWARFRFTWRERNRRRDPDNVTAGAKFVLDALQGRWIPGDGWAQVRSLEHQFEVDTEQPGVTVQMEGPLA